jgi:tetratricopeptide (TPR) repeat protein
MAIRAGLAGNHELEIAQGLDILSRLRFCQGRYVEAESLSRRALAIFEKVMGPDHDVVATSLVDIADVSNALERYALADPVAKRAVAMKRKTDSDLSRAMVTLAASYIGQKKLAAAEGLLKDALAIEGKKSGADSSKVAAALFKLGTIDRDAGRFDESLSKLKRALEIRERRGKGHPGVAGVLLELGDLDQARGENALAEAEYERALSIWAKAGLPEHPQVAKILVSYAKLLRRLGRTAKAREMEVQAEGIRAKVLAEPAKNSAP